MKVLEPIELTQGFAMSVAAPTALVQSTEARHTRWSRWQRFPQARRERSTATNFVHNPASGTGNSS